MTGHAQDAYTQSDKAPYLNGTLTQTIDWTTTFTNVAFKKTTFTSAAYKYKKGAGGDAFAVTSINGDLIQGGATEAKYTFDETIPASGGPCKGMIRLSTLGTHLLLYGESNGHTTFHFNSQLDPSAEQQLATTMQQQTNAACGNREKVLPKWPTDDTVAVVRGLTISEFIELLEVKAARKDPKEGPLFWPLNELANGDGFSFTTGEVQRSIHVRSRLQHQSDDRAQGGRQAASLAIANHVAVPVWDRDAPRAPQDNCRPAG